MHAERVRLARAAGVVALVALLAACGAPGPPAAAPPVAVSSTDVAVGAVTLHVRLAGPPDAPPVVLLHGVPETGAAWAAVAADLAVDHRVVVPDLRGAGRSSFAPVASDAYDKRSMAGDLAVLVARLGLPPATVVGHDMGAMTAVAWARARPDQVARLVLSGGGVPGFGLLERGPPHLRALAAAAPGVLARDLAGRERTWLEDFVRAGAGAASSSPATAGLVDDAVRAYTPPGRLDAAFGQYRALPRDAAENRAAPGPLVPPVVVLAPVLPDLTADTVLGLAPRRRVVVVPGAGHFLPTERPRETAEAIRGAERG